MQKESLVIVRLNSTPIGAASSWYLGKVVEKKQDWACLTDTCKVFELHHQDQKTGQTSVLYNVVHDKIVTDGETWVNLTGTAWKAVDENHVLYKYYQNALTNYRTSESGLVVPQAETTADGGSATLGSN